MLWISKCGPCWYDVRPSLFAATHHHADVPFTDWHSGVSVYSINGRFAKIRTSDFRKVVRQHTEGVVGSITWLCWKVSTLSRGERIFKICYELTKLSPWVWFTTFLGHSVVEVWQTKKLDSFNKKNIQLCMSCSYCIALHVILWYLVLSDMPILCSPGCHNFVQYMYMDFVN